MVTNFSERNQNSVPVLSVKSNAGNGNDVVLWGDPATHALLVTGTLSISGLSGSKTNNAAAPTSDNLGALVAVANAAAPSYSEGNQVLLSTDLSGALRITGSISVGGTTDGATFTAGSSTGNTILGFYHSTIDTVADGKAAAVAITNKRALYVSLFDAAGNALLGQKAMAASVPVVIASDQASIPVAATLAAETTKVIGTTRTLGNAGAIFDGVITAATAPANMIAVGGVYNSTELSPTTGQSTALQIDAKGRLRNVIMDAAGNTRGANVNASNQLSVSLDGGTGATVVLAAGSAVIGHVIVDSGTVTTVSTVTTVTTVSTVTNLAQMNGAALLMGNGATGTGSQRVTMANDNTGIANWGHGALAATAPTGATYQGLLGKTALPTAVSDGQMVGAMSDKYGRTVALLGTIRDLIGTQTTTISASTSETTIVTAAASIFNDIAMLIISNTSTATNTRIDFRDTTAGSILFSLQSNGGQPPVGFSIPGMPIPQTSVNTNWTAQCATSTTDIRVYAVFAKNR